MKGPAFQDVVRKLGPLKISEKVAQKKKKMFLLLLLWVFVVEARLPRFMVIGEQKCGTSSLYRFLGRHPSISAPRNKENHYWSIVVQYDEKSCEILGECPKVTSDQPRPSEEHCGKQGHSKFAPSRWVRSVSETSRRQDNATLLGQKTLLTGDFSATYLASPCAPPAVLAFYRNNSNNVDDDDVNNNISASRRRRRSRRFLEEKETPFVPRQKMVLRLPRLVAVIREPVSRAVSRIAEKISLSRSFFVASKEKETLQVYYASVDLVARALVESPNRTVVRRTTKDVLRISPRSVGDTLPELKACLAAHPPSIGNLQKRARCAQASAILGHSLYGVTLRNWAFHFGLENILVVRNEDLADEPLVVLRHIADHIGADPAFYDHRKKQEPAPPFGEKRALLEEVGKNNSSLDDDGEGFFKRKFNPSGCATPKDQKKQYKPNWSGLCDTNDNKQPLDIVAYVRDRRPPWWTLLQNFYEHYEWPLLPYHSQPSSRTNLEASLWAT